MHYTVPEPETVVAVARDVLRTVLTDEHVGYAQRKYVSAYNMEWLASQGDTLARPFLEVVAASTRCDVCLLGACLLGHVRTRRDYQLKHIGGLTGSSLYVDGSTVFVTLKPTFGVALLELLESFFETSPMCNSLEYGNEARSGIDVRAHWSACQWASCVGRLCEQRHFDTRDMVALAALNLVKNGGYFVLPDADEPAANEQDAEVEAFAVIPTRE